MQIHRSRYSLVLSTLQPLLKTAPTRKCYRQIGGTLVERTVADVVPSLETNYSGIKEVLEGLAKSYQSREKAFVDFQKEYGIQVCDAFRRSLHGESEERGCLQAVHTGEIWSERAGADIFRWAGMLLRKRDKGQD